MQQEIQNSMFDQESGFFGLNYLLPYHKKYAYLGYQLVKLSEVLKPFRTD